MKPEESIVIKEFAKRVDKARRGGQAPDYSAIEKELARDPNLVPKEVRKEVNAALREAIRDRSDAIRNSRNAISREWTSVLGALENCIAFGELLHKRTEDIFGHEFNVLQANDPRPHPEVVTGATLKCILMFGFHARSCIIASEVSVLIKNGFLDGADSRLRTLHEHAVMMTLVGNDTTYEIAERYQDRAAFEYLNLLRCAKRSYMDGHWRQDPAVDRQIEEGIAATEAIVHEARTKWGSMITEQYGWARPILPVSIRTKRNITFADLELAAEMDFLRVDYLEENYHVHAGAHAVIGAAKLDGCIYALHPSVDSDRMARAARRLVLVFGFVSYQLAAVVSKETEEWDGLLLSNEMTRLADRAIEKIINRDRAREAETGQ